MGHIESKRFATKRIGWCIIYEAAVLTPGPGEAAVLYQSPPFVEPPPRTSGEGHSSPEGII